MDNFLKYSNRQYLQRSPFRTAIFVERNNKTDVFHECDILINTPGGKKDEDIETTFKELANQKLNLFASMKLEQQKIADAKAKNTTRTLGEKKVVIIASAVDEKGVISGLDSKASVKDSCWFELLGFCIWK